jgi:(4-(4-[2-(gamma-L-glutamylamino)ethyl]phenoxymethyl)furan-2-yl)methanamine synthase
MSPRVIGLDVGGANVKAVHSGGPCLTRPFPLWTDPETIGLRRLLRDLLRGLPPADRLALTMTGELCDCFASKREGVARILDAVAEATALPIQVWQTDGRFVDLATARAGNPLLIAAANWLALTVWAGRLVPSGPALLLDIGSTTTDIIPLLDGKPVPVGRSDPERLRSGELVYTGIRRTPVCAVLSDGLAAEWFATTHDVYLALGLMAEDPGDTDTADRRPATVRHARARLARMFCADLETSTSEERLALAACIHHRQVEQVQAAVRVVLSRLPDPPGVVILSGSGEFLARAVAGACPELASCRLLSLQTELAPGLSTAACAHAVAVLCQEASCEQETD